MTQQELQESFARTVTQSLPFPGQGNTATRHRRLFEIAQQDLSLAKLAEAHWDALAILTEAGRKPRANCLYAVWASEVPGKPLQLSGGKLSGQKAFCTGFGLVQRALVTLGGQDGRLLDVDVRPGVALEFDGSSWQTEAFRLTNTGAVRFCDLEVEADAVVGRPGYYLERPGFWHGACGPAACWAGGVAGLLRYAEQSKRDDPHTLAHLAAMHANVWTMQSILEKAGAGIDTNSLNVAEGQKLALVVRHSIEQLATDTLRRFARAYGPFPLAMNEETSRRYHEADIFLRQAHGERDLEALGRLLQPH
jgi:hypothetical protein